MFNISLPRHHLLTACKRFAKLQLIACLFLLNCNYQLQFYIIKQTKYNMKEIIKTAKSVVNVPVAQVNKLIESIKYERMLRRVEKENEELLLGYDSPLLYP